MTPLHTLLQQAIEDERRVTGRSKADIARAAGIHPVTLSQHREPDAATLAAVLDHLGRDVVLTPACALCASWRAADPTALRRMARCADCGRVVSRHERTNP